MSENRLAGRLPAELPHNPMHWAQTWLETANSNRVQRNPNAMVLATADADNSLSARVVLCKSFVADPGYIVFYSNYQSQKCADIGSNRRVALVFHWDSMGRQIRIEGIAVQSPAAESDAYFATRDRGSQIGAWCSDQSQPVASHEALVEQIESRSTGIATLDDNTGGLPRPAHWGGIRVWASAIELWIEGGDRIHDRARWTRELGPESDETFSATAWLGSRLQP